MLKLPRSQLSVLAPSLFVCPRFPRTWVTNLRISWASELTMLLMPPCKCSRMSSGNTRLMWSLSFFSWIEDAWIRFLTTLEKQRLSGLLASLEKRLRMLPIFLRNLLKKMFHLRYKSILSSRRPNYSLRELLKLTKFLRHFIHRSWNKAKMLIWGKKSCYTTDFFSKMYKLLNK